MSSFEVAVSVTGGVFLAFAWIFALAWVSMTYAEYWREYLPQFRDADGNYSGELNYLRWVKGYDH